MSYWLVDAFFFGVYLFLAFFLAWRNRLAILVYILQGQDRNSRNEQELNYILSIFAISNWNYDSCVSTHEKEKKTLVLNIASFMVGLIAALMGAGGGIILNPALLEVGLPTEVFFFFSNSPVSTIFH